MIGTVSTSLVSPDRNVREAARDLVAQDERLEKEKSIAAAYQPPLRPEPDLASIIKRVQAILKRPGPMAMLARCATLRM